MNRIIPLALSLVMGIMGCIGAGKPAQSSAQAAYFSEATSLTARTTASTSTITTTAVATSTVSDTTTSKSKKAEKAETTTAKAAKPSTTKVETTKAAETTTVKATEPETKPETTQQKKREKQSGSFAWPADSDAIITAGYPYYSSGAYHGGVDIALYGGSGGNITENTYIYAAQDGVVVTAYNDGNWNTGFGNYCIIDHGNGVQTLYAHSNDIQVSEGDTVKKGQVIGLVGDTGNTTAPHLHFEVRVETSDGCYERTNPLKFISEP